MQAIFNNKLHKENEIQKQNALEAKEHVEDMLKRVNESIQSLGLYQEELNKTSDVASKQSSDTMINRDVKLTSPSCLQWRAVHFHPPLSIVLLILALVRFSATSPINAAVTNNLSANGSKNFPKLVTKLRFFKRRIYVSYFLF